MATELVTTRHLHEDAEEKHENPLSQWLTTAFIDDIKILLCLKVIHTPILSQDNQSGPRLEPVTSQIQTTPPLDHEISECMAVTSCLQFCVFRIHSLQSSTMKCDMKEPQLRVSVEF